MPALVRRLNFRNIELYPDTRGEVVGVRLTDGTYKFVRWLGFIDVDKAKALPGARPVQLDATRYSNESGFACNWHDVPRGQFVQGCLTAEGVFAVTVSAVRVRSKPAR